MSQSRKKRPSPLRRAISIAAVTPTLMLCGAFGGASVP
jgi:hypothetical protein